MSASSLPRTIVVRVLRYTGLAVAIVLSVGGNCDKSPTPPSSTTTSTPATTTTTSTTTTIPASTTTTSSTTTSIPGLDAFISVQGTPCVALGSGPISCTFAGSATGGRTPYTFRWAFTNPANNQVVTVNNQNARPELGCGFSTGVALFSVRAVLTVTDANGATETEDRNQQILRAAGACGT